MKLNVWPGPSMPMGYMSYTTNKDQSEWLFLNLILFINLYLSITHNISSSDTYFLLHIGRQALILSLFLFLSLSLSTLRTQLYLPP